MPIGFYCANWSSVRTTRARIIRLKNDYKDLMKKIEGGLHEHHASLQEKAAEDAKRASTNPTPQAASQPVIETPFAKVNTVADGSPAQAAGMKPGDNIRSFGTVNWMNHENLSKVAEVVQRNEGVSLAISNLWLSDDADISSCLLLSNCSAEMVET